MSGKIVAFIMLFIATTNIALAAEIACDAPDLQRVTAQVSESAMSASSGDAQHPVDDNCGDTSHHPRPGTHQCHVGHCGVIVSLTKFSPYLSRSEHDLISQTFVLNSFPANLFRPPIA